MNAKLNGKILIDRKILDWEWWSDVNTARVFFYLILIASWKDTRWKGKEIKRGTVITSFASLSAGTNLTTDEVRTAIKHLLSTGEITKQSTNRNTLIYIVNYDLYQQFSQTDTKPLPNCSQPIPKPFPTSEEYKESKEGKTINNNNPPLSPQGETSKRRSASSIIDERISSEKLNKAVKQWVQYKIEKRQAYKETGLISMLTQILNNTGKYGEDAVIKVIGESMASNYAGIMFDRLKKADQVDWSQIV